ncbi:hypothetical protein HK101_008426 [Irineochytrium annulatum]|nr:hypothetical protein HK101_008426 [Irineochytrium annulatum]
MDCQQPLAVSQLQEMLQVQEQPQQLQHVNDEDEEEGAISEDDAVYYEAEDEKMRPPPGFNQGVAMDVALIMENLVTVTEVKAVLKPGDFSLDRKPEGDDDTDSNFSFSSVEEEPQPVTERTKKVKAEINEDDEDGVPSLNAPKTKNEVDNPLGIPEHVDLETIEIASDAPLNAMGVIIAHVEGQVVIESKLGGEVKVLDAGTVLVMSDRRVMGRIYETFGPVARPLYSVSVKKSMEAGFPVGAEVYFVPELAKFVFTAQIRAMKGSDASNSFDEEVGDDELEFSDDEKEQEHKRALKEARRSGLLFTGLFDMSTDVL